LAGLTLMLIGGMTCFSGCAEISRRWGIAKDNSIAAPVTAEEMGDDRPWLSRLLRPQIKATNPNPDSTLVLGSNGWTLPVQTPNPEAEAELKAAQKLVDSGELAKAEAAYAAILKKHQTKTTDRDAVGVAALFAKKRVKRDWWAQEAQFQIARVQQMRGHLVKAHDSYETLMRDWPGTRHTDEVVRAEYEIAQTWLTAADPNAPPEKRAKFSEHLSGKYPLIDLKGNALAVLEHVRHHDSTGPLADDAVLQIADTHYADEDYEEAAITYDQLVVNHPKSSLVQHAQIASVDSKIKSYMGPDYDSEGLEQARETIKQTMTMFPERAVSHSDNLYRTLDLINDQDAERTYKIGEHYMWTGKAAAAEFYFGEVPARWPKSPWAKLAKVQLEKVAKMPRKETLPSQIMSLPGSNDPISGNGGGGPGGMGAMGGAPGGMNFGGAGAR
jgi:outer membrane protein assembly factor BamD (BamD/ComL family)